MPSQARATNWSGIAQAATIIVTVGLLGLVFADDRRLGDSERQNEALAARLAEASAHSAKTDQRLAALERAVADARSERDALTKAIDASATAIAATRTALDETNAGVAADHQKLADAESALAGVKSAEDTHEQGQRKLGAAIDVAAGSLARLRADVAWRELPGAARDSLIVTLTKTGSNAINLMYLMNDAESHYFANQMGAAFKAAGWRVNYVAAAFSGVLATGMVLDEADNGPTRDVAGALKTSGLDFIAASLPQPSETLGGDRTGIPATLLIGAHALH